VSKISQVIRFVTPLSVFRYLLEMTRLVDPEHHIDTEKQELLVDPSPAKSPTEKINENIAGFVFLGFVANLAFNYLLQEIKFFNEVFGQTFGSRASFFYAVSTFVGQIVMFSFGSYVSYSIRFITSCLVLAGAIVSIPLMTYWRMDFQLAIVYVVVVILGFFTAVINSSGFTLTSFCSPNIRKAYTIGTCLAGVTGWISIRIFDVILFKVFRMSPQRDVENPDRPSNAEVINCVLVLGSAAVFFIFMALYYMCGLSQTKVVKDAVELFEEKNKQSELNKEELDETKKSSPFWDTVRAAMPMASAVWNVMFVTFLVLPDQLVQWKPSFDYDFTNPNTYHETAILSFNVFDVIGRLLSLSGMKLTESKVIAGSVSRYALVLLYFFATYDFFIFGNDIVKLILQVLFGTSYGLLVTWAFILAPSQEGIKPENRDIAGALMSMVAVFGILVGAAVSSALTPCLNRFLNFRPYETTCRYDDFGMVRCEAHGS
jgi:hypothetical protein